MLSFPSLAVASFPGVSEADRERLLSFLVVGGGPTGALSISSLPFSYTFLTSLVKNPVSDVTSNISSHTCPALSISPPSIAMPSPALPFRFQMIGVEFAAELHDFIVDLQSIFPEQAAKVSITIVEGRGILGGFDASLREYAMKRFRRDRIVVRTGANVTHVDDGKARAGGSMVGATSKPR
jgi:hypothetical protein